jgi:hypothetical protein
MKRAGRIHLRADDPALVALREAAVVWARASRDEPVDSRDSVFQIIDRRLQRAALRFARASSPPRTKT